MASVRHRGGRGFVDQAAVAEALEGEGGVDGVRGVVGDGPGEHMRRSPGSP